MGLATVGRSQDPNGSPDTGQTFLYFGWLTLLVYLATPTGYLVDIQTSYMLKNQLHATATQISIFRLLTGVPVYLSFAFGLMRDRWNPFGWRDRGFFLICAPVTVLAFLFMGSSRLSYRGLLIGMLLVMLSFRFIAAAYQGLIALVGQEKLMSGRLSALWNIVSIIPVIMGAFAFGVHFRTPAAKGDLLVSRRHRVIDCAFGILEASFGL